MLGNPRPTVNTPLQEKPTSLMRIHRIVRRTYVSLLFCLFEPISHLYPVSSHFIQPRYIGSVTHIGCTPSLLFFYVRGCHSGIDSYYC